MTLNWQQCYEDHYNEYFGQASDVKVFRQSKEANPLEILQFDGVFPQCRVFASLGLNEYDLELGQVSEVYLPADDGWEEVSFLFANTLFYLVTNRTEIGWGIAVSGIDVIRPEFSKRFDKTALFLALPFDLPEGFGLVQYDKQEGSLYLAFFISQKEYEFFSKNGADDFMELLEKKEVDPYQVSRKSAV